MAEREREARVGLDEDGVEREPYSTPGRRPLTLSIQSHDDLVAQAGRSSGTGLDPGLRSDLEAFSGESLGEVTVHTGSRSEAAARSMGAIAYATGQQIHFVPGTYDPKTRKGKELIAHEVAHTIQQRGTIALPPVQAKLELSSPGDAHEAEADAFAAAFVSGMPSYALRARGASGRIHRQVAARVPATPSGDEADWQQIMGERSRPVGEYGRVDRPAGLRLRQTPGPDGETITIMPFNAFVRVERVTDHGWAYVTTMGREHVTTGAASAQSGFCEIDFVQRNMPDPGASLHYVQSGETVSEIVSRHYGEQFVWGRDARLFTEALFRANEGRTTGIYRREVQLGVTDYILRDAASRENQRIWQGIGVRANQVIWIPSPALIASLQESGAISSGSISHEAWQSAQQAVTRLMDDVRFVGGFAVGLLKGAFSVLRDLVLAVVDLANMLLDIVRAIVREGFIGAAQSFGTQVIEFFRNAPEALRQLGATFADNWTNENAWERGMFQGEVIGYVAMAIALIALTAGAGAAALTAGRFGAAVRLIRTLDAAGDIMTYGRGLSQAVQVPARLSRALRGTPDTDGARRAVARADAPPTTQADDGVARGPGTEPDADAPASSRDAPSEREAPQDTRDTGDGTRDPDGAPARYASDEASLRQELSGRFADMELHVNPSLGDGVRVHYTGGRLRLEVGPQATAWHVRMHRSTIEALARFTGPLGTIRRILSRIDEFLTGNPGFGSQGAEAALELRKLQRMRDDLSALREQAGETINDIAIDGRGSVSVDRIDTEIAALDRQVQHFETELSSTQAGRGYVASGDTMRAESAMQGHVLRASLRLAQAANECVDSLRATGRLPARYVTKAQAEARGWEPGRALWNHVPNGAIGGDIFDNVPPILPNAPGRVWREADIDVDGSRSRRGNSRLLYSSDGLLYVTDDHYRSVQLLGNL